MNADGSDQTNLSNNEANDFNPSWSSDGEKIAFTSDRENGNFDIYVMNADGSGQTRLTDNPADDFNPTWSPDGEKIAFASDRVNNEESSPNFDIYVMDAADGSGQTRLTNNDADDSDLDWGTNTSSPPDGNGIDSSGTTPSQLTSDEAIYADTNYYLSLIHI